MLKCHLLDCSGDGDKLQGEHIFEFTYAVESH